MINLYPDQIELENEIYEAWQRGHRSVLAVLSTGGGKTVIFCDIVAKHAGPAVVVVHRKEILKQISKSLALAAEGVRHRVVAPDSTVAMIRRAHYSAFNKSFIDQNAQVGVMSAQTIASKSKQANEVLQKWCRRVTLAVFDEAHHYVGDGQWARAVRTFSHCKQLHVTASPERADGKGLEFCDTLVEGKPMRWLINNGRLCEYRYFAPASDLDVADLAVGANGDFNAKALRSRVVKSHLVGDVVKHYKSLAMGKKTIVFASDVETAGEMAAAFNRGGVKAISLSGESEDSERENGLNCFENGDTMVLVNVDLFDEGFDVAGVECVIQARPTKSLIKFLQQNGRGLRVMKGKDFAILIDMVRNWEIHGLPDWPRHWSIAGKSSGSSSTRDTIALMACFSCTQPYEAFRTCCPYCGHVPAPASRGSIAGVDGNLFELDVDALRALFDKREAANASREDFAESLIARNVPPIGRPKMIREHEAAKYRRGVLKNLIGWWIGMQPEDREMAEKYKRFYLRFGVDILTAHTLNSRQTDELIGSIGRLFGRDIH